MSFDEIPKLSGKPGSVNGYTVKEIRHHLSNLGQVHKWGWNDLCNLTAREGYRMLGMLRQNDRERRSKDLVPTQSERRLSDLRKMLDSFEDV